VTSTPWSSTGLRVLDGPGLWKVLEGWDDVDRADIGTFLKKIGMIVTSRIGGTSGPIWGTGFLRAGIAGRDRQAQRRAR